MSIQFSDTVNKTGIVEQVRKMMRVDSTQWPTVNIVNSVNNWLDFLTGYAIGADKRFQWDNTNQSKLPEGTTNLVSGQSDYSFLTDQDGNSIITLTAISCLPSSSATLYLPLSPIDRKDDAYDPIGFGQISGWPTQYDKIADNIIRLNYKPSSSVTNGLKFFFQRTSPYYAATDTTKTSGFAPILDRGFIVAAAYDGAISLGLSNVNLLENERGREEQRVIQYFTRRNNDDTKVMNGKRILYI